MQLGKAHVVRILDNQCVRIRDVDAGLDDSRADQNIDLAFRHGIHRSVDLLLRHFAVHNADTRIRQTLLKLCSAPVDGLHAVVQVIHLPAARQLAADRIEQHTVVLLEHKGLHRMAVERRLLDGGHVPDAGQRHVECARDGRRRQGEHVHGLAHFLERLLVRYAEALLFIDHKQPQIFELDLLIKQLVRTDHNINRAGLQLLQQFGLL